MAAEISGYYAALVAMLQTQFVGRVVTVGDYDELDDGKLKTPALLVDIESMQPGDDHGDEKLALNLSVTVHCILGIKTAHVQRAVRDMAAEVMATLRWQKLDASGLVSAFPVIGESMPGTFRSGEHGYESQQVRFTHAVYIGASVWESNLTLPDEVLISMSPDIGIPHESDYQPMDVGA